MSDEQCSELVYLHSRCSRKATVFVNGVGYCKWHSPDATAKREAASERKYKLESLAHDIKWRTRELGNLALLLYKQDMVSASQMRKECDAIIALEEERKELEGEG